MIATGEEGVENKCDWYGKGRRECINQVGKKLTAHHSVSLAPLAHLYRKGTTKK